MVGKEVAVGWYQETWRRFSRMPKITM